MPVIANAACMNLFKLFISEICQNQVVGSLNSICCQIEQTVWQLLPE
jgi:hypothetical protein